MKAKKIIAILVFCLVSALVFAGCGKKDKPVENNTTTIESQTSKDSKDKDKDKDKETTTDKEEEETTTKKDSSSADRPGNVTPQQNQNQRQQETTTKKQEETKPQNTPSQNAEEQVTEQSGDTVAHKHSYTARVTKEASCTSQGIRTYTCSCGDSYTEYIPMTGHSIVGTIIQNPTCGTPGVMSYDCSVCGLHDHSENLAPTGNHSWQPVYRTESRTSYICSCGQSFESRDAWAAHSNASGAGHGSCSTQTIKVQTGDIDHYECSVCGQIQ